jgi:hypothetical protein
VAADHDDVVNLRGARGGANDVSSDLARSVAFIHRLSEGPEASGMPARFPLLYLFEKRDGAQVMRSARLALGRDQRFNID